jgi:hypothetical protein
MSAFAMFSLKAPSLLTCNDLEGGAKAMCEDIAQRYQTGR